MFYRLCIQKWWKLSKTQLPVDHSTSVNGWIMSVTTWNKSFNKNTHIEEYPALLTVSGKIPTGSQRVRISTVVPLSGKAYSKGQTLHFLMQSKILADREFGVQQHLNRTDIMQPMNLQPKLYIQVLGFVHENMQSNCSTSSPCHCLCFVCKYCQFWHQNT